jgi:uncharacterized tellurite resistance protein B-like protein
MPTRLFKLFRAQPKPDDGLTQAQREAIVDLLHFCMYADNHIALAEDKILDDTVSILNWDPGASFEAYEARSIASARAAKEQNDSRDAFFASIQKRLDSKASRALAGKVCQQLFAADGTTSAREAELASRLRQLLR